MLNNSQQGEVVSGLLFPEVLVLVIKYNDSIYTHVNV